MSLYKLLLWLQTYKLQMQENVQITTAIADVQVITTLAINIDDN